MSLSTDDARLGAGTGSFRAGHSAPKVDFASIPPILMAIDVAVILVLSVVIALVFSGVRDEDVFDVTRPLGVGIAAAVAFVLATKSRGLYEPWRFTAVSEQVSAALLNWIFAVLFVGTMIFSLKVGDATSRLATGTFVAVGFVVIPLLRWGFASWLRQGIEAETVAGRPAIVLGDEQELAKLTAKDLMAGLGMTEARRFALPTQVGISTPAFNEAVKGALQFARQNKVDEVVLVMPWSDTDRLEAVRGRLRALPLPVKLLPDQGALEILNAPRVAYGSSIAIEVQRAPLSRFELAQKRALDIAVSTVALTLLLPLFLAVAFAIKMDSKGPVVFRQRRNGFGGREFTIFKFRSMSVMEDGKNVTQAQRNDKRVTRVGRILRATSIDELPQVLNVLMGHMSIVGPRPHPIAMDDAYSKLISGYAFRHHVKPGITGLAQVKGLRGETAQIELMERRIEKDLWYIDNWSIWLDIRIILRTFIEVLRSQAY